MPGLTSCVQCGSVLKACGEAIETEPPRMSGWKKPLRGLMRSIRGAGVPVFDLPDWNMPKWVEIFVKVGAFGVICSIVPGAGHALCGAFKQIRWFVFAWFICLILSLFLFGGNLGTALLGVTFGLHVWIAMNCSMRQLEEFYKRAIVFVVISFFYVILYYSIGTTIFYDFTGGRSTLDAPYHKVRVGDYLLARSSLARKEFHQGDIAIVALDEYGIHGRWANIRFPRGRSFVQVIAVGGQEVEIKNQSYYVDGIQLDTELFSVPGWLKNHKLKTKVRDNCYFVTAAYNGTGYTGQQIRDACTIEAGRMEAKVIMRWLPLHRRGFIRENE